MIRKIYDLMLGTEKPTFYEKLILLLFIVFITLILIFIQIGKESNIIRQKFNNLALNYTFFCEKLFPLLKNGTRIDIIEIVENNPISIDFNASEVPNLSR